MNREEQDELWDDLLSGKTDDEITKSQLLAFMEVLFEFRKEDNNLLTRYSNRLTELTKRVTLTESGQVDLSISYHKDFYGNDAPTFTETEVTQMADVINKESKNFRFTDPREADYFFKAWYFISLISKKLTPQKLYNLLFVD